MSQTTSRPQENQNTWNLVFSFFFLCILIGSLYWMWVSFGAFPQTISVFDAILMGLATFRITRLVVYDKITRWFRELFVKKVVFEQDGKQWVSIKTYESGFMSTVYDLLQCPWCISFWSALVIAFVYFLFPWAWFVILFLALAGVGSFIQLAANAVGWKAENLKLDAREKEARIARAIDISSLGN